jgi:hypothetical protein
MTGSDGPGTLENTTEWLYWQLSEFDPKNEDI